MNNKLKRTKSAQQLKDVHIGVMLEEVEKDIENFKIIISEEDKQIYDLKNILQLAKTSYQRVAEENKKLKQRITLIKEISRHQQEQQ